jgi:hypothetical protein
MAAASYESQRNARSRRHPDVAHNGESYNRRAFKLRTAIEEAKRARHEADRLAIVAWNMKLWAGGMSRPSPTLKQARTHGYTLLRFECGGCRQSDAIELRDIRAAPDVALWTLEASIHCAYCKDKCGRKPRSRLLELSGGPDSR